MIRPTGPKPKHEFRTCRQAADELLAATMPSLSCVSRSECAYQKQACKQQHASQAYDCNKVKLNNSGPMEMCAKRLSFKRTAKSQKLIFPPRLQRRIHLYQLCCCTSSLHSTPLNHHDFFHRACTGRGAHLPACTFTWKQPTMTCRPSATTLTSSRKVAGGVQPPRPLRAGPNSCVLLVSRWLVPALQDADL